jgi:hypothetical protein
LAGIYDVYISTAFAERRVLSCSTLFQNIAGLWGKMGCPERNSKIETFNMFLDAYHDKYYSDSPMKGGSND